VYQVGVDSLMYHDARSTKHQTEEKCHGLTCGIISTSLGEAEENYENLQAGLYVLVSLRRKKSVDMVFVLVTTCMAL
jgi:hypothetical protein